MSEKIKKIPRNCDNAVQQFILTHECTSCMIKEDFNTYLVHDGSRNGEKCQYCEHFQEVKKDKKKYQQRWRWT